MPADNLKRVDQTKEGIPTAARVCEDALIELVYDREKRETALAVSRFGGLWNTEREVRIETGELLVPYAPSNNLIVNECVLLPSIPAEYGHKHELVADIRAFLHRYVDLSDEFEQIAAYYVLLSWVHDAFNELPYLRLRGDYGSGKTRALIALGSIAYRGIFASAASTLSPIFYTLDRFGGTLILDEADFAYSDAKADMVKLLNNGTVRGMPILRSVQNRHREFNPQAFKVFGPKIIAMRGSFDDKALESRFITEEMGTRPMRSDIPIQLPPTLKTEALALRNRLLHFRLCHFYEIKTDTSALMAGVEPRLNQVAVSLLSIVDDPQVRLEMQSALIKGHEELLADRSESPEAAVLSAALAAFASSPGASIPIRVIADRFNAEHGSEYGGPVSNKWVGYILRKRLRIKTLKTGGIYAVPASERPTIDALSKRYGVETTASKAAS